MEVKIGHQDKELVKKIQSILNIKVDGDFGPKTFESVKLFQQKNNIHPSGILTEIELKLMNIISESNLINKLKGIIPDRIINIIEEPFKKFEINTINRISHFVGQIMHESGNFTIKTESLLYRTPSVIVNTWPSRFNLTGTDGKRNANDFIKNEEKLASAVYDGRMGNTSPGDGFKFRGAGFLQLTGKVSFEGYAKYKNQTVEFVADNIRSSDYWALDCALWEYCINKKLNPIADLGVNEDIIKRITLKINGGYIGLDKRISLVNEVYKALNN